MLLIIRDTCLLMQKLATKRACCVAFILGCFIAFAMPPFENWMVIIPTFCGLILLIDQKTFKIGFRYGYWFGLGYFVTNLYWIAFALNVEIEKFFWLIPLALLGIPAILSFFIALTCGVFNIIRLPFPLRWLCFAGLWGAAEWLRGHLFTGFPWGLVGYSWMARPGLLQCASVIGIYGLSVLTVLLATSPLLYIRNHKRWFWSFTAVVSIIWGAGYYRLCYAPSQHVDNVLLRLVQPCISQKLKWDDAAKDANFATHIRLSQLPGHNSVTHIIWPEAASPFFIEYDQKHRQQISEITPVNGAMILGGLRYQPSSATNSIAQMWNSLFVISSQGDILNVYDKSHLVPFGEYIPLRTLWPVMVKKITHGLIDFSAGPGLKTLHVNSLPPFSPLICYEGIFPHKVVKIGIDRAEWMLNLTNDAWYGNTSGPYQHLAITRMRAIEEGIPLVRVANNGISAVVDAYGRIEQQLGLNQQGVIDCLLPQAISEPTFYAQYGDSAFFIIIILIGLITYTDWLRTYKFNNFRK